MGRRRNDRGSEGAGPIPLAPVDLLAGLAPGVELCADEVPAVLDAGGDADATCTVAEVGRQLRGGDATVRRLIRSAVLEPGTPADEAPAGEPERAGVVPRTRDRPGE
jgi:hypothetical protein